MRYQLKLGDKKDHLAVPARAYGYLSEAGEAELKVLLYACRNRSFADKELVAFFAETLPADEVREALAFWRGAGVLGRETAKKAKTAEPDGLADAKTVLVLSDRPNYTSKDLARAVENDPGFKNLVDYAEHRLQKNFNASDLSILYSFVDRLGLPVEVVMLAIEECASEGKKSLRYIEKLLIDLCDREIDDLEKADEYFKRRHEYLSFEGQIRALCGFGARALTAQEKALITLWKDEWELTLDEIREAYEKTVRAINKPSLSYMHKVLSTAREAEAKQGEAAKAMSDARGKTYDLDEFFRSAVERTKRKRKKPENVEEGGK